MKFLKVIIPVLIGFSLSYIPNNYMDEKYENIAFFIVVGLVVFAILRSVIMKSRKKTDS